MLKIMSGMEILARDLSHIVFPYMPSGLTHFNKFLIIEGGTTMSLSLHNVGPFLSL